MNELQRQTLSDVEDVLNRAHMIDIVVRVDGEDRTFQADWLKQVIPAFTLMEQTIEMNRPACFWQTLASMPISKFTDGLMKAFDTPILREASTDV